jgi:hypothetical protein
VCSVCVFECVCVFISKQVFLKDTCVCLYVLLADRREKPLPRVEEEEKPAEGGDDSHETTK